MIAMLVLAQAVAAPAPGAETLQSLFESASAASVAKNWPDALARFERLEVKLNSGGTPRSKAVVALRKGIVLFALDRPDDAVVALRAGLAALPSTDRSLDDDRREALVTLAGLEEGGFDYPAARRDYRAALAAADTDRDIRLTALAGLARTSMFDDAPAAIGATEQALAMFTADPALPAKLRAQFRSLHGRALMNAGQLDAAEPELRGAVEDLGGLTQRVSRADVSARSDYAILAVLRHDYANAKKYMAYTGAGRQDGFEAATPKYRKLPSCGENGVQSDDVAVIQFGVREDGRTMAVSPVYASRQGEMAATFARAVGDWSWLPEQASKIAPFYRAGTRVELRCTTAVDGPSAETLLEPQLDNWLATVAGATATHGGSDLGPAVRMVHDRAELASLEQRYGVGSSALVGTLYRIGSNPLVPEDVAAAAFDRALRIAIGARAPAAAQAQITIRATGFYAPSGSRAAGAQLERLRAMFADPNVTTDPATAAVLRLVAADRLRARDEEARNDLDAIVGDQRLSANDPARVGALLRIAARQQRAGDLDSARHAFEQTGLSGGQCALADAKPQMRSYHATSGDFPAEAQRWGFEGWVTAEFDLTAAGVPQQVRTIIAYPPFIFGPAATGVVQQSRYTQSYRPGGALGCGGESTGVRFTLNQN